MQKESIVLYAQAMRKKHNDPLKLAEYWGYKVTYLESPIRVLTARSATYENHKLIFINKCFNLTYRRMLCAHELGHLILHEGDNRFRGENARNESEANLFAVALLFSIEKIKEFEREFNIPLVEMSDYTLQTILNRYTNGNIF